MTNSWQAGLSQVTGRSAGKKASIKCARFPDQCFFSGAIPRFNLELALQGVAPRPAGLAIDQDDRTPGRRISCALPAIVNGDAFVGVAGDPRVETAAAASNHVDEVHDREIMAKEERR